jgi:hypothetical protein
MSNGRSIGATASVMLAVALVSCALHGRGHTIDFDSLESADRIEVLRALNAEIVKTVTDPFQVRAAVRFVRAKQSGWKDPISGPPVPRYLLRFYNGSRGIGGYGLGTAYIVSDPTVDGFWSQTVPPDEIRALAATLGLALQEK